MFTSNKQNSDPFIDEVKSKVDYRNNLIKQQIDLLHRACEGIADPIEDKIEMELQQLKFVRDGC